MEDPVVRGVFKPTLSDCGRHRGPPSDAGSAGTEVVDKIVTGKFAQRLAMAQKRGQNEEENRDLTCDQLREIMTAGAAAPPRPPPPAPDHFQLNDRANWVPLSIG